MLQAQDAANDIPLNCMVTSISYAGDEGGIACRLDFCERDQKRHIHVDHAFTLRPAPAARA
jgi:hypothetical protein